MNLDMEALRRRWDRRQRKSGALFMTYCCPAVLTVWGLCPVHGDVLTVADAERAHGVRLRQLPSYRTTAAHGAEVWTKR